MTGICLERGGVYVPRKRMTKFGNVAEGANLVYNSIRSIFFLLE